MKKPYKSYSFNLKTQSGFAFLEVLGLAVIMAIVVTVGVKLLSGTHAATPLASTSSSKNTPPIAYTDAVPSNTGPDSSSLSTINLTNSVSTLEGPSTSLYYSNPQYSPDSNSLAWISSNFSQSSSQLNIKNVNTGVVHSYSSPDYYNYAANNIIPLVWFPGSQKLAFVVQTTSSKGTTSSIYTVKSDGTGLKQLSTSNKTGSVGYINSLAVTNNGNYLVFTTSTGVYSLNPGSNPVSQSLDGSCLDVAARPGSATGFSFICQDSTKGTNISDIQYMTVGSSSSTTLYSSSMQEVAGNVSNLLEGEAWSNDGSTLALELSNTTYNGSCNETLTPEIASLTYNNLSQGLTVLEKDKSTADNGCHGGGGQTSQLITWSPNDQYLAYLDSTSTGLGGLYRIPSSGQNSSPTVLDSNANFITW